MKTALALYTVFGALSDDLEGTLTQIRRIGYEGVEFYGPHQWSSSRVRRALEANHLELCGWHVEWALLQKEKLADTLEYQREAGNQNIVIPCLGGPWNVGHTQEENCEAIWRAYAEKMNRLSEDLKDLGMTLGYHTHAHEFEDHFGVWTPWKIFLENLNPEIFLELDTGNCLEGGEDPVAMLQMAQGRLKIIHCKAFGKISREQTLLGSPEDEIPWKEVLEMAKKGGNEWIAIENEIEAENKLEVARNDYNALKKI